MLLSELLKEIGRESPCGDAEILRVTDRLDAVLPGSLFVAMEGKTLDGHTLADQALEKGAFAVVTGRSLGKGREIVVRDPRAAFSALCAAFYGHPDRELRLIGITGTNGKTSTAEYLRTLLTRTGRTCGLIGTLGCGVGDELTDSGYTTPGSDAFFAALRQMADGGCGYCAAEISSQALSQARAEAASFALGVLTNIGRDHLDYHGKLSEYVAAKSRLFRLSETALLNADDAYCEQIASLSGLTAGLTYSVRGNYADYMVRGRRESASGVRFEIVRGKERAPFALPPVCEFTVYNVLAAVAAAHCMGVSLEEAATALKDLPPVKGRMQRIGAAGVDVYIDFAHTPEALTAALKGLRRMAKGRLTVVFGCGGDRDRGKRPEMGRAAAAFADTVIVTSDNPRGEDPEAIIAQVTAGMPPKSHVFTQPDREKAIALAIHQAAPGDVILVAGKGHEEYQIVSGGKIPFSDEAVVRRLLCGGRQ